MRERSLPFPRGKTANQGSSLNTELGINSAVTTYLDELCGQTFEVNDTVHDTGLPVTLRVLKAEADINTGVAYKGVQFGTTNTDFGRYAAGIPSSGSAGLPALMIDDAYSRNLVIELGDLFYAVERGPCYGTGAANLANQASAIVDGNGLLAAATNSGAVVGVMSTPVTNYSNTQNTGVVFCTGLMGAQAAT